MSVMFIGSLPMTDNVHGQNRKNATALDRKAQGLSFLGKLGVNPFGWQNIVPFSPYFRRNPHFWHERMDEQADSSSL